jgi:hypothetical protein
MRIQFGDINLLSLQDWSDYNLFYILVGVLIVLYCLYYFVVESISDSKNKKVRYALPITFNFDQKNVTQTSIETVRDFFSQIHSLSRQYYTNEIIGLNIINASGKLDSYITSTSQTSLNAIKEALFKDRNLQIEVGDIVPWSDKHSVSNGQDFFITQLKLQKSDFPIKHDSLTFGSDLITTLFETDGAVLSLTLDPYDYQSKFEQRVKKLNQQKQTDKGVMYQSEHNKVIAKQLEDKSKYPIFLVKIEIIAPTSQSIKQITSKFNTLSTSQNKFYSVGTTTFNKRKIENKIHCEYSYSWLMPKPHFYLNSQELACIWQPLKVTRRGDLVDSKEVKSGFKIEY